MMWFYEAMLCLCAYSGYLTNRGLRSARKRHCKELAGMLQLLSIGVRLSALGYAFRIIDYSQPGHISHIGSICSVAGSFFLCLGWFKTSRAAAERATMNAESSDEGRRTAPETCSVIFGAGGGVSLKPMSVLAYQVLERAQALAKSQDFTCIETDHILRSLLEEPHGAGKQIVNGILADNKDIRARMEDAIRNAGQSPQGPLPNIPTGIGGDRVLIKLSERAKQALEFARLEARRFDSAYIGAEHLLLGVLLVGAGEGVIALFQKGVTVDAVRNGIHRTRTISPATR